MNLFLYWKDIEGNTYKIGALLKEEKYIFILNKAEYK